MRLRLCFVVESGTDVRMVEGLAERTTLTVVARRIAGGREISQTPRTSQFEAVIGPARHASFAVFAGRHLLAERKRYDAVVVQGYGAAAVAANLAGRLAALPVRMLVCSPVEAYYRARQQPDSQRPFRRLEYVAVGLLAAFNARIGLGYVALSPYLASVVAGHGGRHPIAVIPVYGVDRSLFTPSNGSREGVRRRLGLPVNDVIAFFSSRVAPEKDAATVLHAARLLVERGVPIRVLNLSGGYRDFLALASSLGLADRVIAADAVTPFEPLASYYHASDVCVQASREEGLGFSPLEALACGVPVVASRVGGLTDTIRDGETGWTVPVGDPEAMARAIAEVLADPVEASARTARGRDLVDRHYEQALVFDRLVSHLAAAVAER